MKVIDLDDIQTMSTSVALQKIKNSIRSLKIKDKKVLFICEDITRTAPIELFFPHLLRYVKRQAADVTILFAVGTHRPMTTNEMLRKLGISHKQAKDIRMINHNVNDTSGLIMVGKIHNICFKVNKAIANHDIIIGISNTLPHKVMGFSGGSKLLCIGAGNKAFIDYTHWLSNTIDEKQIIAKINNPMRDLLDYAFGMLQKKIKADFFSINFVSAPKKIIDVYTENFSAAYQSAAKKSYQIFIKRVAPCNSILAILDQKSLDFWQASKAVYNCARVIRKGGFIAVRGLLPDGISPIHGKIIEKFGYQKKSQIKKLIASGKLRDIVVASHMVRVGECLEQIKIFISSENINKDMCKKINFGYIDPIRIPQMKFDYIVYNPVDITLMPNKNYLHENL